MIIEGEAGLMHMLASGPYPGEYCVNSLIVRENRIVHHRKWELLLRTSQLGYMLMGLLWQRSYRGNKRVEVSGLTAIFLRRRFVGGRPISVG